jgi:hypothetical protein
METFGRAGGRGHETRAQPLGRAKRATAGLQMLGSTANQWERRPGHDGDLRSRQGAGSGDPRPTTRSIRSMRTKSGRRFRDWQTMDHWRLVCELVSIRSV